ncbi:MAG: polysaccharide deacetylase family protein [Paludibacter sp.]
MKFTNILTLSIMLFAQTAFGEITQPVYQIAKWFDDKKAAVSVNFDDNLPGQFNTAMPLMNARGVKGTFYVITNTASSQWSALQMAIDAGHEVGSHSVSHPTDLNFPSIAQPQKEIQIEAELKNSHDAILANLTGQTSLSISWPFGKGGGGNDSIVRRVAKKYYFAARNTTAGTANGDAYTHYQNTYFSAFGRNYYLQSGGVLMTSSTTKANIGTFITEIIKTNGWFSPFYHAVNQVGGYNNVSTEVFIQHMDTIASQSNEVWITTFGNASKYHRQRNAGVTTLTAISEDTDNWTLNLTDNLDNSIFNQAVTILLNQPSFSIYSISQNAKDIPFTLTNGILKFNAVPDGGNIIFKKDIEAGIYDKSHKQSFSLQSTHGKYILKVSNDIQAFSKITLLDTSGRTLKMFQNGILSIGSHVFEISKTDYARGILLLNVQGTNTSTYKLIID